MVWAFCRLLLDAHALDFSTHVPPYTAVTRTLWRADPAIINILATSLFSAAHTHTIKGQTIYRLRDRDCGWYRARGTASWDLLANSAINAPSVATLAGLQELQYVAEFKSLCRIRYTQAGV